MFVVELQEPVIQFILLRTPVPFLNVLSLSFARFRPGVQLSFLRLFFVLFASQPNVTLLAKQGLEVIAGYDLLACL